MKIYEYQAKEIFKKENIEIPAGKVASSPEEAEAITEELNKEVVVKSQVHVGGRGKAGGIKFASNSKEANKISNKLLKHKLKGEKIEKVLIEEKQPIKDEYYLGITLNREKKTTTLIFSAAGGMEIEEIAEKTPEKIVRIDIDPILGLKDFHFNKIAKAVNYDKEIFKQIKNIAKRLFNIYKKYDCLLVEINPLALLENGKLLALDAKLEMDDNARYRQEKLVEMWDEDKENPIELLGKKEGFVVIKMEGNVSVVSNGAGLAIFTLDIMKRHNIQVANFLDLGGGATADKVKRAINVVTEDKDVEAVLINIFGGITRCNEIANGVKEAFESLPEDIPVVCRLQGTNREEGIEILREAGLKAATELEEAVKKVSNI